MLIVKYGIPKVVIASRDPFPKVAGSGIEALKQADVEVVVGVLEQEALALNKRFICFHQKKRPFIILKWAQTANGKIAGIGQERLLISNELTNRLVHRWRSEEAAILVGYHTALKDNPKLDNRFWKGNAPIRMVIDRDLSLPSHLHLFDGSHRTIVFNQVETAKANNLDYVLLDVHKDAIEQIVSSAYQMNIQSMIVEGGAAILQAFIDKGLWDEARIIINEQLSIDAGLEAPELKQAEHYHLEQIQTDSIHYFHQIVQD
jgi:diaminohydroxyphosphoribosylaminopyrimidine deaminase/5-amino-6-(5-phosphoribosylamino)uracil reductase